MRIEAIGKLLPRDALGSLIVACAPDLLPEVLAESTDWEAASAEMKRLQAEWKTIGPVRRSKSEVVWNRFRAAADRFFERYHNRHQIALASKLAEREALVVDLEALAAAENGGVPADIAARVQQLRTTWNRSVPIPGAEIKPLADRWQAALPVLMVSIARPPMRLAKEHPEWDLASRVSGQDACILLQSWRC